MSNIDWGDDPGAKAFAKAFDDIRSAVQGLPARGRRLALTVCLGLAIVDDGPEDRAGLRLAQAIRTLGDIVNDMLDGDGDDEDYADDDEDPRPAPPSPDLLRKFLERRRAGGAKR